MVALAKAESLVAAAIIAGFAAGFDFYLLASLTASVPREDALTAVFTFVAPARLRRAVPGEFRRVPRIPAHPNRTTEPRGIGADGRPCRAAGVDGMTTLAKCGPGPAPARHPPPVRFVADRMRTSFYLLLSAVPLYARSAGAGTGLACG